MGGMLGVGRDADGEPAAALAAVCHSGLRVEIMGSSWDALIVAFGSALAGAVTTGLLAYLNRRKTQAEAGHAIATGADELVGSALGLVRELKADMAILKGRVAELEDENCLLRARVEQQERVITEQGRLIKELQKKLETCQAIQEDCE